MYIIRRTDKEYGKPKITHPTLEGAILEAERLAKKHVDEKPEFVVYRLDPIRVVTSQIIVNSRRL